MVLLFVAAHNRVEKEAMLRERIDKFHGFRAIDVGSDPACYFAGLRIAHAKPACAGDILGVGKVSGDLLNGHGREHRVGVGQIVCVCIKSGDAQDVAGQAHRAGKRKTKALRDAQDHSLRLRNRDILVDDIARDTNHGGCGRRLGNGGFCKGKREQKDDQFFQKR